MYRGLVSYLRLDDVSRLGFSKAARSCPGHREAGWYGDDRPALAIGARLLGDDLLERSAERAQAVEANVEADIGHCAVGRAQQKHGSFDPTALQVPVRRLAKRGAEGADEMRLRDVRDLRERRQVERLRVGTVHRVAGAQHPAVDLLYGPAHGLNPFSRRDSADRRLSSGSFVPSLLAAANENASLVPFAGQQDGVSRSGAADSMGDALAPVLDARIVLALSPANFFRPRRNFAEDGHGILFARVFVGENRVIAQAGGDLAHPGPLLAITIAGAAEDRDQLPPGDRPQLAEDLLEALRRVRVIEDHAERLAEVDALHPSADAAVTLEPRADLVERQPDRDTRGCRGQGVRRVPAAAQLQVQRERPKRCRGIDP